MSSTMLCRVAQLSHDEISFDLHSLDWLVSTRFLLIALLGVAGCLLRRLIG